MKKTGYRDIILCGIRKVIFKYVYEVFFLMAEKIFLIYPLGSNGMIYFL